MLGNELENVGRLISLINEIRPVIKGPSGVCHPLSHYGQVPHNIREEYQNILNKAAEDIRLLLINEQTRLQNEFDNIEIRYKT